MTCLKPECCNAPLRKHNEVCKATLLDIGGPHPTSKISLRCSRCGCIYGYSKYGSKHHNGEHYYSGTRDYIETSDVVYIHRRRKILKVGGAQYVIARAACAKFFDHAHLGSKHAHFCTIEATVNVQPRVSQ